MSLLIVKPGIVDTIQDAGRYGHQHLGINPNGAMDRVALNVGNMLVGNGPSAAALEFSFPAPVISFKSPALLALSGADFGALLNGRDIPINTPVIVPAESELKFTQAKAGVWAYLAVAGSFALPGWLGSHSTHLRAGAGGFHGRRLRQGDEIPFNKQLANSRDITILPWRCNVSALYGNSPYIRCLPGQEFDWMAATAKKSFQEDGFTLTSQSDRMGYHLQGKALEREVMRELISTAVIFGTLQLLPSGQIVVLMADHQTTGGYPRIAQVVSADLPKLAQSRIHSKIHLAMVSPQTAEQLREQQHRQLNKMQVACSLHLGKIALTFNGHDGMDENPHAH